jgi:hypothetical protein
MHTDYLLAWLCFFVRFIACANSLPFIQCTSHSDCSNMNEFCSRIPCAGASLCGACRPSAECYCDSDSIDSQCPSSGRPTLAVRFLQGIFRNQTTMQAPGYECIRRLVVTGVMFTFSQFPVFTSHPASTATLDMTEELTSGCPSLFKSGVFPGMTGIISSELIKMNATISSEGAVATFRT